MVILKKKYMKLIVLLSIMNLLSDCSKNIIWKDDELSTKRNDYTGNQLRVDGYYMNKWGNPERVTIYFFNNSGVILEGGSPLVSDLGIREKEFKSGEYYNNVKIDKLSWGVFKIINNKIEFEKWYPSDPPLKAFINSGIILNDTTFQITKSMRSNGSDVKEINEIYHFRSFSPKPDSTNSFVR